METPEFYAAGFHYNSQFTLEKTKNNGGSGGDSFIVDELLADFPSDDGMVVAADGGGVGGGDGASFEIETTGITGGGGMTSTTEESVTGGGVHNSCNSSFSGSTEPSSSHFPGGGDIGCGGNFTDGQFSSELCVPYDDLAELEWLSNFVEESFSSDDLQKLQLISGMKAQTTDISQTYHFQSEPNRATSNTTTTMFRPEMLVPAKARSKRSRAPPCNWTSRLLAVSTSPPPPPPPTTTVMTTTTVIPTPTMSSSSESDIIGKKKVTQKKKETFDNGLLPNSEGRRCLHCATDKTPQWRTGPMGPKTLCNACGVRYKSGRLVPEYRPAASPTFVLTKHSNSHRKVLELRRQKEFQRAQQHQQHHHQQQFIHPNMMFDVTPSDDFLIHQHLGTDFRQLI